MELLQLRYFLTVAKMLNISRAAEHHMIPQPAMSQTISKLEKELGTPLFNRYKNKLSLTEEGKEFYRSISISISGIDNAVSNLTQTPASPHGELTLLVLQHRSNIVDCISEFKKLYPKITFKIYYDWESVEFDDVDLCISNSRPNDNFDDGTFLISEQIQLVVSSSHPFAQKDKIQFDMLKDEEFAVVSKFSNQWQQTLLHCNNAGFNPKPSIICSDLHCLMRYVASGMAITVGAEHSWRHLKNDSVSFINTDPGLYRTTYVFKNGLRKLSDPCNIYYDFLIDYFSKF